MITIFLLFLMVGFHGNLLGLEKHNMQKNIVTVFLKNGERYELSSQTLDLLARVSRTIADILESKTGQDQEGTKELFLQEISKEAFSEIVQMVKMPR